MSGWTVRVNRLLLADMRAPGEDAPHLLDTKLYEISRVVPEPA